MATSLGKVGIVDRGNYLQEETYNAGDFVLYNGSTWLALKDGLLGAEPAEGTNWKYLARGFEAEVLSLITANDTSGLLGDAGQQVNAQSLMDVIADKVATKLVEKGMIANNLVTTNENMVLAAPMGKALQEQITEQNKNIDNHLQKDGTFYVAGNPDFVFLELQKELLRLRLQIEHHGDVRLWKSEDGGISFPTFKTLITNSDFKKVTCTVDAIADQITEIPDAPKEDGYIHFIRPYLSSSHLSSLNYSQGRWIIYTNKTQKYTITFCKIP